MMNICANTVNRKNCVRVKTFFPQIHLKICIWDSFPKISLLKKTYHEQNHRYRNHRFEGPNFRHPSGVRPVSQKA